MARALEPLELAKRAAPGVTEWTMEANPSSVTRSSLEAYRSLGVNRISMGVQALRPDLLSLLGRVHSKEAALGALEAIFEAGYDNVSVDLLCGAPSQGLSDLEEALGILTGFPITHLSCYLLTLPKHHRMHSKLPGEETQLEHLLFIDRYMRAKGFEHYEISNFAKPGKRARHNLNYWQGGSYLGLGPSAHSYDQAASRRWKNVSSLHRYASLLAQGASAVEWAESLTAEQQALERWMLTLRLDDGFPETWLTTTARRSRAEALAREGLLENHPGKPGYRRLTARGFALSDQVISTLA
jgi:oxygen-independent coproporphyrinogen III oxidase